MCGIAGYAALDARTPLDASLVRDMLGRLVHRGPDDEGLHVGPGIVLGHRRLAVIDLEGGHQPLAGAAPGTWIVANGEIYNFRELKRELVGRGHRFRTRSDTEVAAHAYDEWGVDFLDRLDGMFALALWDAARGRLLLARDRLGEKPLYYAQAGGLLLFASELSALLAHPALRPELDASALSAYLALEYVPAPRSMVRGASKLEPGCVLVLERGHVRQSRFWEIPMRQPPSRLPYREAVQQLRDLLDGAVRSRLVADVPLGIFLSGGLDSSTVAALAARNGAVKTFTIAFRESSFDESGFARTVAARLGSEHHEQVLEDRELLDLVPRLARILDEPLGDASIVPTALLSAFAREHVTVALGGDGGDELFAGYPMHQGQRVAALTRRLPASVLRMMQRAAGRIPVSHANFALGFKVAAFLKGAAAPPPLNHALWMSSFSPAEQTDLLHPDIRVAGGGGESAFAVLERSWERSAGAPLLARAAHLDATTYLPNDILTKVDRASMAVALEVRAPFLARSVVEFAFGLPDRYRMRALTGKRILRDAVADLVPRQVLRRPKKGFGMPVAAWLNGPLRPLVRDLLSPESMRAGGLFRPEAVARLLREHETAAADHRKPLWTLLVFELWRRQHLAPGSRPARAALVPSA